MKPNSHEFGEKEMQDWWKEKNYLGVRGEKAITEAMSEDEAVALILKDVL